MSAETELYAALTSQAGLTALVGNRIYPDAIPENVALPAVVFVRASTQPTHTLGGVLVCEFVSFTLTAWAESRAAAEAVADQISAALALSQNLPLGRSSGFDNEVGLYAVTVDADWFFTV